MTKPFLITGLPRSRTAWFAAVANTVPGAICYHEPLMQFTSWEESLSLWSNRDREWTGISDSAIGFHLGEILRDRSPKVLIVDRSFDAIVLSLRKIGIEDPRRYCDILRQRLQPYRGHPDVKVAAFDRLSDTAYVRSCLWHLMPGAEIDGDKIQALQRFNVQAHMEIVNREVAARRDIVPAMLGADVYAELCV